MAHAENFSQIMLTASPYTRTTPQVYLYEQKKHNKDSFNEVVKELEAIVQLMAMIVKSQAKVDKEKAQMQTTFAESTAKIVKDEDKKIDKYYKKLEESRKWGIFIKVISGIVGGLLILASLATGNVGLAAVMLAMTVAQETGATEKLTKSLSGALGGGTWGKIGADAIVATATILVGAGAAGVVDAAANAVAEGTTEVAETTLSTASKEVEMTVLRQTVAEEVVEDSTQAAGDAATGAVDDTVSAKGGNFLARFKNNLSINSSTVWTIGTMAVLSSGLVSQAAGALAKKLAKVFGGGEEWIQLALELLITLAVLYFAKKGISGMGTTSTKLGQMSQTAKWSINLNRILAYVIPSFMFIGAGGAVGNGFAQKDAFNAQGDSVADRADVEILATMSKLQQNYQNDKHAASQLQAFSTELNNISALCKGYESVSEILLQG